MIVPPRLGEAALCISRTLQFQSVQVNDIHAIITIAGFGGARAFRLLCCTALEVEHGLVLIKAERLLLPDAVNHFLVFIVSLALKVQAHYLTAGDRKNSA